jgi:hypothetical protein
VDEKAGARLSENIGFCCDVCNEVFSVPVRHCTKCNHHWSEADAVCKNCSSVEGDTSCFFSGVIYELLDPRNMSCRYVGQSFDVEKRKKQHLQVYSYQGNYPLFEWKGELARLKLTPILSIIESNVSATSINERERYWCQRRSNDGCVLLNRPVGSIRKEDLFGMAARGEIVVAVRELREMLLAINDRYDLPKSHRISKEWWKCQKALLAFQNSFMDY